MVKIVLILAPIVLQLGQRGSVASGCGRTLQTLKSEKLQREPKPHCPRWQLQTSQAFGQSAVNMHTAAALLPT
eukprot:5658646-Amphidinium_carterae.1